MRKPTDTSVQTLCVAVTVVVAIAVCSTLLSITASSASSESPVHHHQTLFAEIQRLSAQIDAVDHNRNSKDVATRLDIVDVRLADFQAAINVLAEAMMETVRQGRAPNAGAAMRVAQDRDADSGVMVSVSSEDEDSPASSE
jgi:hypothetical protein